MAGKATEQPALVELARLISETLDPRTVAERIVQSLHTLYHAQAVVLLTLEPNGDLRERASSGDPGSIYGRPMVMPAGTGFLGLAVRGRVPFVTPDVLSDPRVQYEPEARAQIEKLPHRAILAVPLSIGAEVIGVLGIRDRHGRTFTKEEILLAGAFAGLATVALENARLHDAAARRERTLQALVRAGRSVMAGLDLDALLRRVLEATAELAGSSEVKITLLDEKQNVLRVAAALGTSAPVGTEFPMGRGYSGMVAATGRPLYRSDIQNDPANVMAAPDRVVGLVTYLGVPIRYQERVLGVLSVNTRTPRVYDDEEQTYLESFADQVAIAIANVRRFERERGAREYAERIGAEHQALLDRLQTILDRMPLGCIVMDTAYRFTYWNPAAERIFGWSFEDVRGHPVLDVITAPRDRSRVERVFGRLAAGETTSHAEGNNVTKDGLPIVCEWRSTPLHDSEGGFVGILSMCQDVTERRQMQEALLLSEERYRAIVESSIQGVLVHVGGKIKFANAALVRLMGYDRPEDAVGRDTQEFVVPAERERMTSYREARRRGEDAPSRYELQAVRKDGSLVWLDCSVNRVMWDGAPALLVALVDVTERKALEERLGQSQKMEAIGALAGGVAHDFNNLLTVIGGRASVLLGRLPQGDPARRDVELIGRTAERAATLTRQLLAFARRQTLQPQVLDLNALVSALVPMLQRLLGEDVQLDFVAGQGLGSVRADRGQIEQVIVNLAVNARDAMPRGGRLTIETCETEIDAPFARSLPDVNPGSYVQVAISDTGVGMDAQTLARVFEPFFTTKPMGRGTGLGLATVYGIVKQSGGHIQVQSEPNQGSSFRVYLPKVDRSAPTSAPKAKRVARGSETVLLVEDDGEVRDLAREVLEGSGYTVLEARNGADALRVAQGHSGPVELLVTDVVMPGMSGRELAERFAADRPSTRVLYTSGYTDDAVVRHGVLDSTMAFLQKPFSPETLVQKVREVLDRKG